MASGNSLSQWRLLAQVRDYLSKTSAPSLSNFQKDLPDLLKKVPGALSWSTTKDNKTPVPDKVEENPTDVVQTSNTQSSSSVVDVQKALRIINTYIPLYFSQLRLNFGQTQEAEKPEPQPIPKWMVKRKDAVSKASVDARTRYVVQCLHDHLTVAGKLRRLEDLCSHLIQYPHAQGLAVKSESIPKLIRMLKCTEDSEVESQVREALALLGYTPPVKGQGIRLLSIDGGGVRGLVALEILRKIEEKAQKPIHELFDYICGVSTGAIVAVLVGVHRKPLRDCKKLYRQLSTQIFSQSTIRGAKGLFMNNSYYDSDAWTDILQKNMGEASLIKTARDEEAPKLSLIATQVNTNRIQAFVFRNYNLPYRVASHFLGSSSPALWQAVRASAAAPGYFSEFRIGDQILLDGGVFVNNPTAIAVHEAKQLWPEADIQCVVSIGTGRHEPIETTVENSINWGTRIRTIVNSATDTEAVHTIMHDLLPGNVYYRFNPYLSEEINLDEIRSEKLAMIMEDTHLYLRKNNMKLEEAAATLNVEKSSIEKAKDWLHLQKQVSPIF
ncbi:calcium-independent phospholipase A2-gamma-like isoform X2 [Oratosquilla oratoria]